MRLQAKRSVFRSRKSQQAKTATSGDTVSAILFTRIQRKTRTLMIRTAKRVAKRERAIRAIATASMKAAQEAA